VGTDEGAQPETVELDRSAPPARYAVVEGYGLSRLVLCLLDDFTDADTLALELRRRGARATTCRTITRR